MALMLRQSAKWLFGLSDLSHRSIVLGATSTTIPLIQSLPPSHLSAVCLTAVGTQLGTQLWVGNVAGPTMFLNLNRQQFGDVQARLFPKYGMLGFSTSLIAFASYHTAHPEATTMTYLLAASAASQLFQSFVVFPLVAKYQFRLRELENGSREYKSVARKFGVGHGLAMLIEGAVMGINIYFFYTVGCAVVDSW